LRGGEESAVGQKRGPGEVVGEADLGNVAGLGRGEPCEVEGCFEKLILGEKGDLVQKLEALRWA
jgi:hypothetical protein